MLNVLKNFKEHLDDQIFIWTGLVHRQIDDQLDKQIYVGISLKYSMPDQVDDQVDDQFHLSISFKMFHTSP